MKLHASPPSLTSRILRLTRRLTTLGSSAGVSMLLLGAACSSDDEPAANPVQPRGNEQTPSPSPNPTPSTPMGTPTPNNESIANGTTPLDGEGATDETQGVASGADAGAPSPGPDAAAPIPGEGDAGALPPTDPNTDENLVFIQQDGFSTTYFALECHSIAEDGTVIEAADNGGSLPVGGGTILQCSLEVLPSRATTGVLSTRDEQWCALGELQTYVGGGDERLIISVVTPPDVSPAFIIATREGEPINLVQAAAFGALVWPVWIETVYDVNEVAPAEPGRLCDETFGLQSPAAGEE